MVVSLSLSLSSIFLEGPAKELANVFGDAAGLGSQPLRWRRSITQTDREEAIGLRQIWRQRLAIAAKLSGLVVNRRRPSRQVRRCLRFANWPLAAVFRLVSFPPTPKP